jgi:hypothetical protein
MSIQIKYLLKYRAYVNGEQCEFYRPFDSKSDAIKFFKDMGDENKFKEFATEEKNLRKTLILEIFPEIYEQTIITKKIT